MSRFKKIATLSLGQGINVLVGFLFLPYMARLLPVEDYGTYGQVLLIVSFTIALFSFGLSQIIYVYLNRGENKREILISNIYACFILGLIASAGLYFLSDSFSEFLSNPKLATPLRFYAFAPALVIPFTSLNAFLIYKEAIKKSISISVCTNLVKVFLVVGIIHYYGSISLIIIALLLVHLIQLVWVAFSIKKHLILKTEFGLIYEQIVNGFPLALTGILGTGILYIDGLMVSKFLGVQQYAIYRNGALEVPYISTIYSSIAAIIMPEVAQLFAREKFNEIAKLKRKVITNTMVLIYPILVFLLFNSNEIIVLYLGE